MSAPSGSRAAAGIGIYKGQASGENLLPFLAGQTPGIAERRCAPSPVPNAGGPDLAHCFSSRKMQKPNGRVSVAADACGTSKKYAHRFAGGTEAEFLNCEILEATAIFITRVAFFWENRITRGKAAVRSCSHNNRLTICFFITIGNDFALYVTSYFRAQSYLGAPVSSCLSPGGFQENRKIMSVC
jgi:hypothetical protein